MLKSLIAAVLSAGLTFSAFAADKFMYHPTFEYLKDPSYNQVFGTDMGPFFQILDAEIAQLKAAKVTMVSTGFPDEPFGASVARFGLAVGRASEQGIKVFVPLHDTNTARYANMNIAGFTLPDEPFENQIKRSDLLAIAKAAKIARKTTHLNFGPTKVEDIAKYLEQTSNSGGIFDATTETLIDYIDIISLDDYSTSTPRGYAVVANLVKKYNNKRFMAVLGNTADNNQTRLQGQLSYAKSLGASIYGLWSMTGRNDIGAAQYSCSSGWQGNQSYNLWGTGVGGIGKICLPQSEPQPANTILLASGLLRFSIASIVNSNPTIWNWFKAVQ